ncbi:MAG: ATP synthase F1 subunit delta [Desulfobacterales bacterium]|nr:ATP synthase F1 subunit delta [Desulfobacterales bacterium]
MKNLKVGRRYAKALLLIGKEDGKSELYREELVGFVSLLEKEIALSQAICNPLYSASERRKVLQIVIEKLVLSKVITQFLFLLFEKGRIDFLSTISDFYQKLADELKGVMRASLISASELSTETVEKIRATLSKMTGKDIILELKQDPSLIGGVVVKVGDLVLDGCIKTQLHNMRESLKRGERL